MSDLQCPARIVLALPSVSPEALSALLVGERVARLITDPVDLGDVADLHRGETVVVVADAGPHVDRGVPVLVVEIDADGLREVGRPDVRTLPGLG